MAIGQTVGNPPQEPQEGLRLAAGLKEILGQVESAIPGRLGDVQPKIVMEYTPDGIQTPYLIYRYYTQEYVYLCVWDISDPNDLNWRCYIAMHNPSAR